MCGQKWRTFIFNTVVGEMSDPRQSERRSRWSGRDGCPNEETSREIKEEYSQGPDNDRSQRYRTSRQKYDEQRRNKVDRYVPDRQSFRERSRSPPLIPAEEPNFKTSGLLAAESNKAEDGKTTLKYHEPPDAVKPNAPYRFEEFKDAEYRRSHKLVKSSYLVGRDRNVCDIVVDEKECSSQHAVIQFRKLVKRDKYGDRAVEIKPYIIDLDSTNGTAIDGRDIPGSRFVELKPKDTVIFGGSTVVDFVFLKGGTDS
jgi:smad nuclear-interacting protein 1